MNRSEFENRLRDELKAVPDEERESALKYYREYFDDAGVENEQKVIEELESPEVIAAGIKKDLNLSEERQAGPDKDNINESSSTAGKTGDTTPGGRNDFPNNRIWFGRNSVPVWAVILIAILFIPVILPLFSGVFGAVVGIVCGAAALAIGCFAIAAAVLAAGIAVIIVGISTIVAGALYNGILLIGIGLTLLGLGILSLIFAIQFILIWIPQFVKWIIRAIRSGFRNVSIRKGEYA
ncbi:MAG: DUF1700 domain-containing protein [Saccharofermentanales bacterium]